MVVLKVNKWCFSFGYETVHTVMDFRGESRKKEVGVGAEGVGGYQLTRVGCGAGGSSDRVSQGSTRGASSKSHAITKCDRLQRWMSH